MDAADVPAVDEPACKPRYHLRSSSGSSQRSRKRARTNAGACAKAAALLKQQHEDVLDAVAAAHPALTQPPTKYLTDALALTPPVLHAAAARAHVALHRGGCWLAFPDATRLRGGVAAGARSSSAAQRAHHSRVVRP